MLISSQTKRQLNDISNYCPSPYRQGESYVAFSREHHHDAISVFYLFTYLLTHDSTNKHMTVSIHNESNGLCQQAGRDPLKE